MRVGGGGGVRVGEKNTQENEYQEENWIVNETGNYKTQVLLLQLLRFNRKECLLSILDYFTVKNKAPLFTRGVFLASSSRDANRDIPCKLKVVISIPVDSLLS